MGKNIVGMMRPCKYKSGASSSSKSLSEGGGGTSLLMFDEISGEEWGSTAGGGGDADNVNGISCAGDMVSCDPETGVGIAPFSSSERASPASSIKNGSGASGSMYTVGGLVNMGSAGKGSSALPCASSCDSGNTSIVDDFASAWGSS